MISNFLHEDWADRIDLYSEEELDYRKNGLEGGSSVC